MSSTLLFEQLGQKYSTPKDVQRLISTLEYNDSAFDTVYSAASAFKKRKAHCLEASFLAAAILETKGFDPLVLSLESLDNIDHVVYLFKENKHWGAIGKSREAGLQGRAPVFRSVRDLVWSYVDPYIDDTGLVTGYQVISMSEIKCDWRWSKKNVWAAEQYMINFPHKSLDVSEQRFTKAQKQYFSGGHVPQSYWW